MQDQKLNGGSAVSNTTPGSQVTLAVDEAKINVFFDGTKNNIFNTRAREQNQGMRGEDSYANDATSTALMWEGIEKNLIFNAVYIDGIGTTRLKEDNQDGYAVGRGETGIVERAQSAFDAIKKVLIDNRKTKLPTLLNVNVYGFSRGAATARHFVHLVNDKAKSAYPKGWGDMELRINFVGLFDTVSSYEPRKHWIIGGHDFDNDVAELHLNFAEGYAQKVIHLVAGDEYRKNFSVTTIASAIALGIGHEMIIPGAHSDVGGSYNAVEEESGTFDDRVNQFVLKQGWFGVQDLVFESNDGNQARKYVRKVSGEYSKVAHTIMVEAANAHLSTAVFEQPVTTDPAVKLLKEALCKFAKDPKAQRWDLDVELRDRAQAIRREFLHISFNNNLGMGPRMGAKGVLERKFIMG